MAHEALAIRAIEAGDEMRWRALWKGYCDFYEVALGEDVTAHTFRRLLDPSCPVDGLAALNGRGELVGIAHYLLQENTWTTAPVCYLEDLFVVPEARGTGVGRALLDWLVSAMHSRGWARLYWLTKEGNATARRLYDHYTRADGFVRYVVRRTD